jgi:hypothetical protein
MLNDNEIFCCAQMLPIIFRLRENPEKGGIPEIASDEIKGYECNCHYFLTTILRMSCSPCKA